MTKSIVGIIFFLLSNPVWSKSPVISAIEINSQSGKLTVTARQASLNQVFAQLTSQTATVIHYDVLAVNELNVSCTGSTVAQVVKCLLENKADMIVLNSKHAPQQNSPEEIWVLNSVQSTKQMVKPEQFSVAKGDINDDRTSMLIKMAASEDPNRRSEAISAMAIEGRNDDGAVHEALEGALIDPEARVRVQAVSSLARREGRVADALLKQALQDQSESVRLMAIDHAGDNIELLQQALTDSNPSVRALAVMKLAELPTMPIVAEPLTAQPSKLANYSTL